MYWINIETVCTGSFSVLVGSVSVNDSNRGVVCFTCHLVEGAPTNGCFIEYISLYTEMTGNISIRRLLNDTRVTECKEGFYTDVYTVKFYDDKFDELVAYELNHQLITGLNFTTSSPLPSCTMVDDKILSPSPSQCTCNG